jgi:hypothetical protein
MEFELNKKKTQNQIVVLAFTYDKEQSDLLEKYEKQSINLTSPESEDRLKKIVHFFSQNPLPTKKPTIDKHGLAKDYTTDIEYIRGPHCSFVPIYKKNIDNIYTKNDLIQLCVRCVGTSQLLLDLEEHIQEEFFVVNVDKEELEEMSKLLHFFNLKYYKQNLLGQISRLWKREDLK